MYEKAQLVNHYNFFCLQFNVVTAEACRIGYPQDEYDMFTFITFASQRFSSTNIKTMTAAICYETTTTTYTTFFLQRYRSFQRTLHARLHYQYYSVHYYTTFGNFVKQMYLKEHNLAKHYSVIMATQEMVISVFLKSKFDL
jgi:hypothetical protein